MDDDEWRKINRRCSHGWLRGEQCEICNAPKREWVGLTDEDKYEMAAAQHGWEDLLIAAEAKLKERNT